MKIRYRNIPCSQMTGSEIDSCSRVFSENYGKWSSAAPSGKAGRSVRLSSAMIRSMFVDLPDRYVALVYDGDRHIGQVFYLRRPSPWHPGRNVTFVLQLVVVREYRGKRLGLSLLQSVFGLSDDDAWGIFSSNPLTIRALEDATFRHVNVDLVGKKIAGGMQATLSDVLPDASWLESYRNGCVDTHYPVEHAENERKIKKAYPNGGFPFADSPLREGEEWLAITFRAQTTDVSEPVMRKLTETSWTILQDAYSRMPMQSQRWAAHTAAEVEYLFSRGVVRPGDRVLDLGCGNGRHAVELAKRGCVVHGVDFAGGLIAQARAVGTGVPSLTFEDGDARIYRSQDRYDVVLCVYDVIGSSIDPQDGESVVETISSALKPGGRAVVSVMNLDLTCKRCKRADNRFDDILSRNDFAKLMRLPASQTMQGSGDVFKGQLILLNPKTGIAYRREIFEPENGNGLKVEYVIPDRRFTQASLRRLMGKSFVELSSSCVCAGHWDRELDPTDSHAKEVLGIFEKLSQGARIVRKAKTLFGSSWRVSFW